MGYKITTLVENCVYGRKLQAEHGLSLYIAESFDFHTNLPPRYYLTFMQKSQRSLPRPSVMLLSQISFGCSPV